MPDDIESGSKDDGPHATTLPFVVEYVAGTDALARRDALAAGTDSYPVIIGVRSNVDEIGAGDSDSTVSREALIERALAIDVETWFVDRAAADPEQYDDAHGVWPETTQPLSEFTGHTDILTGALLDEVAIVLSSAPESWQVPCYLGYGGWNDCPDPEEHSAIFRRWQERYGARIVTMSLDTIELSVEQPPTTAAEALELAGEHFLYCSDIVHQGTGTLEGLAATLLDAPIWFFWWD